MHREEKSSQIQLTIVMYSDGNDAQVFTESVCLSAASPDTNEVHTWLALNNGASLEVEIAHSRELKKQSRKIFRSWSVHRLGKI
jgi:hypothetical protein